MSEAKPSQPLSSKTSWIVLQFILPVLLAIVAGYGSVKYAEGESRQKLLELERRVQAAEQSVDKLGERTVSRQELRQFMESVGSDLTDIKTDIREMRGKR